MRVRIFPEAGGVEFSYQRDIDVYFIDINRLNATLANVALIARSPSRPLFLAFIDALWIYMWRIEL